jgi:DNA-binding transcriptional LysR family regulator
MIAIAVLIVRMLRDCFKPRPRLEAEILVLRHQLNVLQHQLNVLQQRTRRRLHLRWADRALFIWLYRRCPRILDAITIVRPETVVRWHRKGFAAYWRDPGATSHFRRGRRATARHTGRPRHLVTFRRAYPQITIRLAIGNTAQVAAAVESGTAELGFAEGAVKSKHFVSTPVARDQLVVVVGPRHPWVGRERLTVRDLMEGDWVLREPGSGTRSVFENALLDLGAQPDALRAQLELPSNEAVRAAVEVGLGVTAISASVAAPSIEAGRLISR